ncbi:MAG: hypothetical protein IKF17_04325 [Clostridia bacterium]|nr:hypothetical protein [Clostridia bacterium]
MPNVFMETFRSPFGKDTPEQAEKVLSIIRENHPASKGWRELDAGVELHDDGKWYAWRKHEHFR